MVAWSGQALIGRGTTQKTSAQGRVQDYKRLFQNERWMDGVQLEEFSVCLRCLAKDMTATLCGWHGSDRHVQSVDQNKARFQQP